MIKEIDSRALGTKVFVYRNLHNGLYSVRDTRTRLVLGHSADVGLVDCQLKVSEKGRQRVVTTRRKNVHAGIEGVLHFFLSDRVGHFQGARSLPVSALGGQVFYNPYVAECFRDASTKNPVYTAQAVRVTTSGVYYA